MTDFSQASAVSASSESSLPHVLFVEDDPSMARAMRATLDVGHLALSHAATGTEALRIINEDAPDVVLLDLQLPDMHGLDVLRAAAQKPNAPAFVVITAETSIDTAVKAMSEGAVDFIPKPFKPPRVLKTVASALENGKVKREFERIKRDQARNTLDGLVGASRPMQTVYRMIEQVARSKASVFITGESGTGKDVVAEAVHRQSDRAARPFVALNCGAIPKDLMESELFGHVKGAFTGATGDRQGAARRAHGGTLFLDELGEMDINLQSKLLRFVQTGDVQPVGGSETTCVDVRFICATNRNPEDAVRSGLLREDLFYRLNVIPIHLPPLRERGKDILLIANHFLARYAEEEGKPFSGFTPETEEIIKAHAWPGNVRELQNVIRRIVVLHEGPEVRPDMLPIGLRGGASSPLRTPAPAFSAGEDIDPLWIVEKHAIERAIALCEGNVVLAAAKLGINPSTIYRKKQGWAKAMQAAE